MTTLPKIAYIILAHKNPSQLCKLINRLSTDNTSFFIHIDKRIDIKPFQRALASSKYWGPIIWIKREKSYWGRFGLVQATINGIRSVLANDQGECDTIVLLSGQDYPIKSNKHIAEFFLKNKGTSFIDYHLMPTSFWPGGGMDRIERYHVPIPGRASTLIFPPPEQRCTIKRLIAYNVLRVFFLGRRRFPKNLKPYGGSQWWCLTRDTAHYVLQFLKKRPDFVRFFRYTAVPDEMFFQTLLVNSPLSQSLNNCTLTYAGWNRHEAGVPSVFVEDDFFELEKRPELFARKFDITRDANIFKVLDKHVGSREMLQT